MLSKLCKSNAETFKIKPLKLPQNKLAQPDSDISHKSSCEQFGGKQESAKQKRLSVPVLKRPLTPLVLGVGLVLAGCSSAPSGSRYQQPKSMVGSTLDSKSTDELEELLQATDMRAVESSRVDVLRYGDLWRRVRAGFKLDLTQDNERIRAQQNWFISRQTYIDRLTARASYYLYYTILEAERRGIPTELALLPVIESSYDPTATSNAAAAGMWQFIPSTGRIYGLRQTSSYDGRRDVIESTRAAYDFLTSLYNKFGSWELALAAYNCGPGCVQRSIGRNEKRGRATDFWSLDLPTETKNYVPRFLAVAKIINNPRAYGVSLPSIANRPHFRSVPIQNGISMYQVSQMTGVDVEHLLDLNPGFVQGRTDYDGPNRLLVPATMSYALDGKISALGGGSGFWAQQTSSESNLPVTTLSNQEAAKLLSMGSAGSRQNPLSSREQLTASVSASAGANTESASDSRTTFYNQERKKLPSSSSGLAEFAASARVPNQTATYIKPVGKAAAQNPLNPSETANQAMQAQELAQMNALPTSSAQVTQNETVVQYPALSSQERAQIAAEIKQANPDVGEVIDPLDGEIKLEAIQTQQSVLEAQGKERELSFKENITAQPNVEKPKGERSTYIIKSGDTLLKIAERYSLSWRDIAKWNQMKADARLVIGSPLYLYGAKEPKPKLAAKPVKTQNYRVQAGDGLIQLAKDFGMSVDVLAELNGLSPRDDLILGQVLKIPTSVDLKAYQKAKDEANKPTSYRVQSGDTMIGVAARFGLSASELAGLNGMKALDDLKIGQVLSLVDDGKGATAKGGSAKLGENGTSKKSSSNKARSDSIQSYRVQAGDGLIQLAKDFGMSVDKLASMNDLATNAGLRVGQRLNIPADIDLKAIEKAKAEAAKPTKYKVTSGDTMIGVAARFGLSASELAGLNGMKALDELKIGQVLKLTGDAASTPAADKKSASSESNKKSSATSKMAASAAPANPKSYKVQAGDGLIMLAKRFGLTTAELANANKLKTTDDLQVGQTLTIPTKYVDYKVQAGDGLIMLAKKYGISTAELAKLNGMKTTDDLQLGQTVKVPAH